MRVDVDIDYTNYRGERAVRRIIPVEMTFSASLPWHSEVQWTLLALDVEKREHRSFAMKDIHSWKVVE